MNGVDIHDQLKTSYEVDRKSRFQYHLRIFLNHMDSVVVNAHVIYKKKVYAKMSLLNFKIILAELMISFTKTQNHCRGTSAHRWITTTLKRTR